MGKRIKYNEKTQLEDFIFNYMDYQTDMVCDNLNDGEKVKLGQRKNNSQSFMKPLCYVNVQMMKI